MRATAATFPLSSPRPWIGRAAVDRVDGRFVRRTLLFLALHAPLGYAIKASAWIATAHALGTAVIAFLFVADTKSPSRVIPVFAYIVASESLWRSGKAMVFSEMAKYLLAVLAILAAVRFYRRSKAAMTPVVYFLALVPSILVMPAFDREEVSFNLSGPFSLAVTTFFLRHLPLTARSLRRTLTALMGPIVALASIATFSTLTTEDIDFYRTKIASGGLGQNQASSLLGLGALAAFLYISLLRRSRVLSWTFGLLGAWCASQGALTFSRGGIATTAGAAAAGTFFLSLDRRSRGAALLRVASVLIVATFFLVPVLDSFTEGALTNRFSTTHLTGRDKIIQADLIAFRENPLLGVGPGQSKDYHKLTFRRSSPHTEYSRLLAEHGLLGGAALLLLLAMGVRWVWQQNSVRSRAFSAALVTWTLLYMFHAAMRMAAVSFVFALASTFFLEDLPRPIRFYGARSGKMSGA